VPHCIFNGVRGRVSHPVYVVYVVSMVVRTKYWCQTDQSDFSANELVSDRTQWLLSKVCWLTQCPWSYFHRGCKCILLCALCVCTVVEIGCGEMNRFPMFTNVSTQSCDCSSVLPQSLNHAQQGQCNHPLDLIIIHNLVPPQSHDRFTRLLQSTVRIPPTRFHNCPQNSPCPQSPDHFLQGHWSGFHTVGA
jgi:hypothetical protein